LRTRPPSRLPSPEPVAGENGVAQVDQEDDSRSDVSSSGLPPPLITAGDYDALVCRQCVSQIPILRAWAGTPGVTMVVREGHDVSWKVIGELEDGDVVVDVGPEAEGRTPAHVKASDPDHTHAHTATQSPSEGASQPQPDPNTLQGRKRSIVNSCPSSDGPSVKRSRTSETSPDSSQKACLAPATHPLAQAVFAQTGAQTVGAGDIFLSGDWRKRWCSCDSCFSELRKHAYLLEEEETYQPPEDPDSREFQSPMIA
jgi:E3 ubiquitin-protein ligase UBR7